MPAFKISPVEKEFSLEKTDAEYSNPAGSTTVRIRQASQAANEHIDSLFVLKRQYNLDDPRLVTVEQTLSTAKLHRLQAMYTLVSCNIEDENGKLLFTPDVLKDEKKFADSWGKLPPLVATEIVTCVHAVNISWGPEGEAS